MEIDHQFFAAARQLSHHIRQIGDERQHQHAPHQLEQQAAERYAPPGGVLAAGIDHRQQAAAEVGADHRQSATFSEITPDAVRVAVSSTAARLE